jgi:hypothetical protein
MVDLVVYENLLPLRSGFQLLGKGVSRSPVLERFAAGLKVLLSPVGEHPPGFDEAVAGLDISARPVPK